MTPQPSGAPAQPPSASGLAIAALILACIPCGCTSVAGLIMGIVALSQINARPQQLGGKGVAIAAIIIGLFFGVVGTIGMGAAIAIPNFIKFQARSKQSECKTNLKAAFFAEKAYFAEKSQYSADPAVVGFSPEKGNRYLYAFGNELTAAIPADDHRFPEISNQDLIAAIPADLALGVQGTCPDCSITIACAGNVDRDPTLDVWTISSLDRPGAPAGTPVNRVDDIRD